MIYINYTDLGKAYKGYETFHIASALFHEGLLNKVYVRDYINTEFKGLTIKTGSFIPKCRTFIEKYINKNYNGRDKSQLEFDKKISKQIKEGETVILGVSGLPECAKKARKLIVFATSAHPKYHQQLMKEELNQEIELTEMEKHICDVYAKADLILARSPFNKRTLVENGIPEEKIKLIWNGVNLEKFIPEKKKDNIFRVLFMSNVTPLKGLKYLIEAWLQSGINGQLIIVGRRDKETDDLLYSVRNTLLDISIQVHDHTDNPVKFYNEADVVVLPSLSEGSPMVLLEAMSCGKPTIAFENSGSPAKESGFILPNRDITGIKDKLKWLYDNPELKEEMGRLARKEAMEYTYSNYTKRIIEYIKEAKL
jgi:glycosyltransferase involved in cell wall biosynthesis